MAALDYLHAHGLEAEPLPNGHLSVWPTDAITAEVRVWIKAHREALLQELITANDSDPLKLPAGIRLAWTLRVGDKRMVLAGVPYTREQAYRAAEARWPGADLEVLNDAD